MRLPGIDTMEANHAWLPGFIETYNGRFARLPANAKDLHPLVPCVEVLDKALAWREVRVVLQQHSARSFGTYSMENPSPKTYLGWQPVGGSMASITRRTIIAGGAALVIPDTAACPAASALTPLSGLHARALPKGMFFGTAVDNTLLHNDAAYMARVSLECGMVVAEASFKWDQVHPAPGKFTFEQADNLMAFAAKQHLSMRGHTLVWHEAMPDWLPKELSPTTGEDILTKHIRTVVQHFRHRLAHWDVVNEVLNPADKNPFGLRDSPWLNALGPRYLDIAFETCAATDPGPLRLLNEYGTDYAVPWEETKRGALLNLLASLKARNVPIQAVGLQAHLDASQVALDQKVLNNFVNAIAAMGLSIIVTELDVRDNNLPADIPSRDTAVAAHTRAWLDAVLACPAVLGVLSWGLSDRRSWLNDKYKRADDLPQRPLPLDADLRRKKMWDAIADAFASAPRRTTA